MTKVHIIGAGLAGLAAGVKLADAGKQVILYEAAPQAGGRCRSYFDTALGRTLDNGNHLVLGVNRHALAYINTIKSQGSFLSPEKPCYSFVDLDSGAAFDFQFHWAVSALMQLAFAGKHQTVADCVNTRSLSYKCFIQPFCTAVLNTEASHASATMLRGALWKVFKSGKHVLRYFLPRNSLSESLIEPACRRIEADGGTIVYNSAVRKLEWEENYISALQFSDRHIETKGDAVILATSPQTAAKLLSDISIPSGFNAIVNGHFVCPDLLWPTGKDFIGVIAGTAQWMFYRGGILSTTTSAANALAENDLSVIAELLWKDVCHALQISAPLPPHRIICEKRATHAITPGAAILTHKAYGNLFLAGDYTQSQLPATIDSAVKSGFKAAEQVIKAIPRHPK